MKTFPNSRFGKEDIDRVREVLASNFSASHPSRMCVRLEELWAEKIGAKHAVTFSSGTATLHASLDAVGIKAGDQVAVPALGPIMTANAVLYQNAMPVFVDVDKDTFNIDPEDLRKKVGYKTRVRATMPVALYGLSPNMDSVNEIAKRYGLAVIEDNAQAIGATYGERRLGTIGDMASFSLESSKSVVSGDGGVVTTNSKELADRCRSFRNHGFKIGLRQVKNAKDVFQDPDYKRHTSFGWAYRMPEVACAIVMGQVQRFDKIVNLRIKIAKLYREVVEKCDFMTPQQVPKGCKHVYWTYVVKFEKPKRLWRKFRQQYMKNGGDGFYACWSVPYLEPVYSECKVLARFPYVIPPQKLVKGLCPVAEKIQPQIMQFCTNYGSIEEAMPKIEALRKTVKEFK